MENRKFIKKDLKTMKKEIYCTNNKLISKLDIYFDVNPSQFNNIQNSYIKTVNNEIKQMIFLVHL